ncbi:hypothetical protein MANES_03G172950v8 [Manihot esculenta]|uniref:Uncharacterized protein n=1 Tax=Manihot esculenta TaxID=3983 RepID=A0ACB7I1N1_MANES|nr:hypothetical protein MANES_03G172950v8 [Manihot esculenta]
MESYIGGIWALVRFLAVWCLVLAVDACRWVKLFQWRSSWAASVAISAIQNRKARRGRREFKAVEIQAKKEDFSRKENFNKPSVILLVLRKVIDILK